MGCLFVSQKVLQNFKWKNKKPTAKIFLKKKIMEFGWGEEWDLPHQISGFIYKAIVLRGHGFSIWILLNQQNILENPEIDAAWRLDS